MKVNIVMLVKDRIHLTMQTLSTLKRNTPADLYNLTIVNDGSNTLEVMDPSMAILNIKNSKGITGQARNLGIYWAEKYWGRGDYLYLTDNDVYFTPGWLDRMATLFAHHADMLVLGGWNHPFLQPSSCNRERTICSHDAVTGASQLMKWSTWDKYGPLDVHAVGVGKSEDWAFCQKIIKEGGRVGSVYPRVVLNCGLTNTLGQPSPGADVMLKELVEAKQKYPSLYWE